MLSFYCINLKYKRKNVEKILPTGPRLQKSAVRQISNAASEDRSCEFEPLSGKTFHQDYYPQSLPRFK